MQLYEDEPVEIYHPEDGWFPAIAKFEVTNLVFPGMPAVGQAWVFKRTVHHGPHPVVSVVTVDSAALDQHVRKVTEF